MPPERTERRRRGTSNVHQTPGQRRRGTGAAPSREPRYDDNDSSLEEEGESSIYQMHIDSLLRTPVCQQLLENMFPIKFEMVFDDDLLSVLFEGDEVANAMAREAIEKIVNRRIDAQLEEELRMSRRRLFAERFGDDSAFAGLFKSLPDEVQPDHQLFGKIASDPVVIIKTEGRVEDWVTRLERTIPNDDLSVGVSRRVFPMWLGTAKWPFSYREGSDFARLCPYSPVDYLAPDVIRYDNARAASCLQSLKVYGTTGVEDDNISDFHRLVGEVHDTLQQAAIERRAIEEVDQNRRIQQRLREERERAERERANDHVRRQQESARRQQEAARQQLVEEYQHVLDEIDRLGELDDTEEELYELQRRELQLYAQLNPSAPAADLAVYAVEDTKTAERIKDSVEDDCSTECALCFETGALPPDNSTCLKLPCGPNVHHSFHKVCLSRLIKASHELRCPLCRRPFELRPG